MLSITSAAKQFNLPRDVILNAVRDGRLDAVRDRGGVLRIKVEALLGFLAPPAPPSGRCREAEITSLSVMKSDRLPLVAAQHIRLLRDVMATAPTALRA
jgi:excisionase family DNA binding protein